MLFTFVGLLGLLSDVLPGTVDRDQLLPVVLDATNLVIGLTAWMLPWSRWPGQFRLVFPVLALASVAVNSITGVLPIATIGVWYVLVFVWIGTWNSPRTALVFSPYAVATYLVPFFFGAPQSGSAVPAVILVVPVAVLVGISLARKTTADLARRAAEDRISTILEGAPISLFACDAEGLTTFSQASQSVAIAALYPWEPAAPDGGAISTPVGRSVFEIFRGNPARLERIQRAMLGEEFMVEVEVMDKVLDVHYKPVHDDAGAVKGVTTVAFDVTERVKAQRDRQSVEIQALADSRRQARTDELTGLANRRNLYEHLDTLLASGHTGSSFALLLLDLDRFKEVNDALGHTVGDRLLYQTGSRLSEALGDSELIARLGGDEFALVLAPGSDERSAVAAAESVIECFGRPFDLSAVLIHASVSVGIALYPDHATSHSELMRCADVAMYRAKRSHKGFAVYDRGSDGNAKSRLVTTEQLREAIGRDELVCYFQPKLAMSSGQVVGAEALVRWHHPTRGLLVPADFLGLAEQTGLMSSLSRGVLSYSLAECRKWHDAGQEISVAVNLAMSDLLDTTLPDTIAGLLGTHRLSPQFLVLEITENAIMGDPERVGSVVAQLRAFGVGFSVDDYGTGYSSLSYLRDLPIHELKLDRSFVTGISSSPRDQAIVKATVSLARSLGLRLVAEGVETSSDWDCLRPMEVEVAQGYGISRPQCSAHFATWLAAWYERAQRGEPPLITDVPRPVQCGERCGQGDHTPPPPTGNTALQSVA